MAVKTYRLGSGQDGNFAALFEADQTAASRTDGWTVAKIAATNQSDFDAGTKQVSGSFAISAKPASFITSTIANAFKIPAALLGTFANTAWTFSFAMRAGTASAQAGRIRLRVFKASDAAGTTNVVELTGATQVGTTTAALSTSADQMTTVTWNPGATIRLNNEFLFFVIAWEITTASGSNSGDVVLRTGQAAVGTRVVTPDFVANVQVFGILSQPITFGKAVAGIVRPRQYGVISLPITFGIETAGQVRSTQYSAISLPLTFNSQIDITLPGRPYQIDSMDSITGWSYWNTNYTPGFRTDAEHIEGTASLIYGGGDIGDKEGGFQKTLQPYDLRDTRAISFYVKPQYDSGYGTPNGRPLYVRLGTSSTVYWEGIIPANTIPIAAAWNYIELQLKNFVAVGGITSWNPITYIAFSWATPGGAVAYYDDINFILNHFVPSPTASDYENAVMYDAPTAYWRMDDSGLPCIDKTINHLDLNGSAGSTVAGVPGLLIGDPTSLARSFNGSFVNRGGLLFPINTFSIEMWIKRNQPTVGEVLICQYNGGIRVDVNSDGTISLVMSYGGYAATTSILKITDTNPHHIVVTRNGIGGQIVFYLDGVSEIPSPSNPNFNFAVGATNAFFVGSEWGNGPLNGTLDEVAIYSRIVTPTQVQNHYTIGSTKIAAKYYGKVDVQTTFSSIIQGQRTALGSVAKIFIFNTDVRGIRKAFSSMSIPITFGSVIEGKRKALGQIAASFTFVKDVVGQRKTFGQTTSPYIFSKDVRSQRKTFGQTATSLIFTSITAGRVLANTYYGVVALPIVFAKDVMGIRKTFGKTATSFTFIKDVKAVRKTFGKIDLPLIFIDDTTGRQHVFGQFSMQTLFGKEVAGRRKTFGQIAVPLVFSKAVAGRKQTFGQVTTPINAVIMVAGTIRGTKKYGIIALPITFNKEVIGQRKTFGHINVPLIIAFTSEGARNTTGKFDFPMHFVGNVGAGHIGLHGKVVLPIVIDINTIGHLMRTGVILNRAESIYLGLTPVQAVYVENQKVWGLP